MSSAQKEKSTPLVLVMGATGRLGRILQAAWEEDPGFRLLWQGRSGSPREHWLYWDPLTYSYPATAPIPDIVLNLSGVTRIPDGSDASFSDNVPLGLAAFGTGAKHVFLMSTAAVYGAGKGGDLAEDAPLSGTSEYALAKAAMEAGARAFETHQELTVLRLGNVAGADALLGNAERGDAMIVDSFPDQPDGPRRSYIGPFTLARVLAQLITAVASGAAIPPILNVAAPGSVTMGQLLEAAGVNWTRCPARPGAIARVVLDTGALQGLVTFAPKESDPAHMVKEWRRLGRE